MELGTVGGIRTPNAQGLSLSPLPVGLLLRACEGNRTLGQPLDRRLLLPLSYTCIRKQGVEPWSLAYQASALTIVLLPSGCGGNRTLISSLQDWRSPVELRSQRGPPRSRTELRPFAGDATTLVADQSCSPENRTQLDRSREGYSLPCVPALKQRKKVESNHQPKTVLP